MVPSFWPTSRTSLAALTTDRWHFIQPDSGTVELYDLQADPRELKNLAASPEGAPLVFHFRSQLRSLVTGGRSSAGNNEPPAYRADSPPPGRRTRPTLQPPVVAPADSVGRT
jgi:hypothetical protein